MPQGGRDRSGNWGKRSEDPFIRWLQRNPERVGRVHLALTVGMILFWIFLIAGVLLAIYFIFFGD